MGVNSREIPPFHSFMELYRDDVYRYLVASVGAADADDCFQETFLSALRAYPGLAHGSNLRAWVLTIARRKAIDHVRGGNRRPAAPLSGNELVPEAGTGDGEVWERVRMLPPKQGAAVLLRYGADLDYEDVGRVLSCTEAAARRNVSDGLRKLREAMK